MNLTNLPATEILKILKGSLNKEKGDFQKDFEHDQSYRWRCIDEIHRRGSMNFLKELNWPFIESGIYKNRYTAREETLLEMFETKCHHEDTYTKWLEHDTPFLCENWLPKSIWVEDECFKEYLPKNKLTRWF